MRGDLGLHRVGLTWEYPCGCCLHGTDGCTSECLPRHPECSLEVGGAMVTSVASIEWPAFMSQMLCLVFRSHVSSSPHNYSVGLGLSPQTSEITGSQDYQVAEPKFKPSPV